MEDFKFTTAQRTMDNGDRIKACVRFDDSCNNGHQSFAVTAEIRNDRGREVAGGCLHDEVSTAFPELAPFIKWHLTDTDGPMHYVANGTYWAQKYLGLFRVFDSSAHEAADPKALGAFKRTIVFGAAPWADEDVNLEALLSIPKVEAPEGIIWEQYAESPDGKAEAGKHLESRVRYWLQARASELSAAFSADMVRVAQLHTLS